MSPGDPFTPTSDASSAAVVARRLHNFHLLYLFTEVSRAARARDPRLSDANRLA